MSSDNPPPVEPPTPPGPNDDPAAVSEPTPPKPRPGRPTQARRQEILERRDQVAVLIRRHTPKPQIARITGTSISTVYDDERAIRKAWQESYARSYNEHCADQDALLDMIERAWIPVALAPTSDPEAARGAALILHRCMERRARLHGLDRPVQVDAIISGSLTVTTPIDEAIEALLSKFPDRAAIPVRSTVNGQT